MPVAELVLFKLVKVTIFPVRETIGFSLIPELDDRIEAENDES